MSRMDSMSRKYELNNGNKKNFGAKHNDAYMHIEV